jgi:hypothetical protein
MVVDRHIFGQISSIDHRFFARSIFFLGVKMVWVGALESPWKYAQT